MLAFVDHQTLRHVRLSAFPSSITTTPWDVSSFRWCLSSLSGLAFEVVSSG